MTSTVLWGARGDRRGLAIQSEEFDRHMNPAKTIGIQMTPRQSPYPNDWRGYEASRLQVHHLADVPHIAERVIEGMDSLFSAETPYWDPLYDLARGKGVRTVLQPNWEFCRWATDRSIPKPDLFAVPSPWHFENFPTPSVLLPAPVNRTRLPFRLRTQALTFVHPMGHPAGADRCGTQMLGEALPHITGPCTVIIRCRKPFPQRYGAPPYVKVIYDFDDWPNYEDIYKDADVAILPRRYGGQSLPFNEASSLGMPIIALDRFPENSILMQDLLVPCRPVKQCSVQSGTINVYGATGKELAKVLNRLIHEPELVQQASKAADAYAESIAWHTLKPKYEEILA